MRVLLVNDYAHAGGAEHVLHRTRQLLDERGHDTHTLFADEHHVRRSWRTYISCAHARRLLRHELETFNPDIIHLHNIYHLLSPAILADCATRTTARTIMSAHDHHFLCPNPGGMRFASNLWIPAPMPVTGAQTWSHRWDPSIARSCARAAQHSWNYTIHHRHRAIHEVITPSARIASLLMQLFHVEQIHHIPNPPPTIPDLKPETRIGAIVAARLTDTKGVAQLLDIFPTHIPITIVGDGPQRARCESIAESRNLNATFLGHLDHPTTLAHIARAETLILPSRVLETAPLVIDEAHALGARIIVSDRSGIGSETVYAADDPGSLADALGGPRERTSRPDWSDDMYIDRVLAVYGGAS
jgi:glycosyltransferase involved in cell wall biosynthesis